MMGEGCAATFAMPTNPSSPTSLRLAEGNPLKFYKCVHNNTITGSWTLTGITAGYSGSGTFTMNKS